jgi:glycosyltransferase involved in cell wall biosynthesis
VPTTESLHVLVVSRWFHEERRRLGGQPGSIGELLEALSQTGIRMTILSQAADAPLEPQQREAGGLRQFVFAREKRRPGWALLDKLLKPFLHYRKAVTDAVTIRRFITQTGPYDAVIAQCEEPDGVGCAIASLCGNFPPLLTMVYDLRYRFDGEQLDFIHCKSLGFVFRRSARVVAISDLAAEWQIQHYGVPPEKSGFCRLHLTRPFLHALKENKVPLAPPENRILFLGALNPKKAPDVFLRAATLVAKDLPGWKFALTGDATTRADHWLHQLRAMDQTPPLAGNVDWLGMLTPARVREEICRAKIVVCPSLIETFSRTTVEALALERPVIVTETTGAASWVRETGAGLVIPPANPTALAAAMRQLALTPDDASARDASKRILSELTPEKAAQDLLREISNAMATA